MNPLYQVKRTLQANAKLFYQSTAVVTRNGAPIIAEMPCLVQRDVSALNYDPASDEQPELASLYFAPEHTLLNQDIATIAGEAWRVISTNRGRTWNPHEIAIVARGGDLLPQVNVTVYRRQRNGSTITVGEYLVAIVYSGRLPQVVGGGGINTRRVGATLVSNTPNLPLRRNDSFSIEESQITGIITDVFNTATGTEAECYITRGFEEPSS